MRILLVGCEYVGTTTLAKELYRWGAEEMGADFGLFHDHWKIPNVTGHWPIDTDSFMKEDEQGGLLSLAPKVKEQMQRHSLYYHIQPGAFRKGHEEEQGFYSDYLAVGMHIEDSVYGPLYFDYGADGQPGARSIVKKTVERALLEAAPDFVLVLMEASPDTIRSRMKAETIQTAIAFVKANEGRPASPAGRSGGRRRARPGQVPRGVRAVNHPEPPHTRHHLRHGGRNAGRVRR